VVLVGLAFVAWELFSAGPMVSDYRDRIDQCREWYGTAISEQDTLQIDLRRPSEVAMDRSGPMTCGDLRRRGQIPS
jgi:hypothetical protein